MKMSPKIRLILDLGPLLAFFLAYRFHGLLAGTATLIICTLASLIVHYALEKRIAIMPLISGVAIATLGGLTLFLQDETFIKIKPTLVNLLFAAILLGGLLFKKPLFKYVLDGAIHLTDRGWYLLSLRWGLFFIGLALLNEFIWRHYPTDFWVNFKVFGMFTLTMAFTVAQVPLIKKYWVEPPENS